MFPFILIKCGEDYKVYKIWDIYIITVDLLQIKEKYLELIDDKMFSLYIKKLLSIETYIKVQYFKEFGKITYYSTSPID